jgi:hypothetical protein
MASRSTPMSLEPRRTGRPISTGKKMATGSAGTPERRPGRKTPAIASHQVRQSQAVRASAMASQILTRVAGANSVRARPSQRPVNRVTWMIKRTTTEAIPVDCNSGKRILRLSQNSVKAATRRNSPIARCAGGWGSRTAVIARTFRVKVHYM